MQFVQNFPFFSILLTLMGAVASSVMSGRRARHTTLLLMAANLAFTVSVMIYTLQTGDSYAYKMGHFPAPWGNEIRVGVLETVSLTVFLLVMLFSFLGGMRRSEKDIEPTKYNIYCILTDLTMLSLIALVYTNDLFTAFVFIEINTLAAAGLVMMRQHGRALVAGVLGMREDDDRLPNAFAIAAERGLKYSFSEEEMRDVHENTVRMTFNMTDGSVQTVTGSSIGGGQILITSINGFDVEYTAQSNAIIIAQYDRKGVISHVTGALAEHDINIGVMRLSRRARGDVACTIIEVDAHISPNIVAELRALPDIISVRAINVQ